MATPMFDVCQSRITANYAAQTGVDPAALPPGTIATIISVLLPILLKFLGSCSSGGTPPTTGAAALIDHCKNNSVMAHLRIQRQIRLNGGLDAGMSVRDVSNTIITTGAQSTPDEVQKLAEEMGE